MKALPYICIVIIQLTTKVLSIIKVKIVKIYQTMKTNLFARQGSYCFGKILDGTLLRGDKII